MTVHELIEQTGYEPLLLSDGVRRAELQRNLSEAPVREGDRRRCHSSLQSFMYDFHSAAGSFAVSRQGGFYVTFPCRCL